MGIGRNAVTQAAIGKVYLAGAGPGDPDLLTVKTMKILQRADVVFHDDLVPQAVLELAGAHAEVVSVGKRCGAKGITQAEINARMIEAARGGLDVLRLKGGDPSIFGRLAEEMDALEAAGIPFEIIPGITAGCAAAASLGVSLTDRRKASRVVILSNHRAAESGARNQADWQALLREETTLVLYMPGHELAALRDELISAGLSGETPAVLVSRMSMAGERIESGTLESLGRLPSLDSPVVLLIGGALDRVLLRRNAEAVRIALEEVETACLAR